MEFEIKNAHGEILRLFAEPGDNNLRFEVIPSPLAESFAGRSRSQDEPAISTIDGPPVEVKAASKHRASR